MEIGYFDVSTYIVYTMGIIFIPALLFRLGRAFPYYVKNGNLSDNDRCIMYADYHNLRKLFVDLFTHPNPRTVIADLAALTGIGIALWMAWIVVPFGITLWIIYKAITTAAKRARERYLKKQEFVAKLKGDV